ncbi:MAG: dCTP deaminase [Candidatus Harrisonbacteria bacterium CG10_big_fil_rev_8_21_14_0_10_38_8]|uniref:dCTP deaminase n=1 Tax=Candidatus Harrisonbacteria bacterium CG10_big_fil_rev_8_21_14_0_10_38_8 TaxID=1974582 RepID=A0A2M6WKB2_9BACT|nr:MAG: dCTP deaminase [Candidatus Harrisonbacteria bacterium CG10_big_fil_rev_8_21_14_0_10_38_8]
MALSDKKILEAMKDGDIVINPFKRENLATSSYDLTLGEWYFVEKSPEKFKNIYNIYDKKETERVWGKTPKRAEKAEEVFKNYKIAFNGISKNDQVILLEPGETILAHTDEFIGGRNHITTMMKARSSMGRNFIEVCKCAGWGDVGYINRWTMEITNNSSNYSIPLVVGRRVAQLIFFETGEILQKDYTTSGKYQTNSSISQLKKSWKPESMLPRLYNDREIKKR